MSSFEARSQPHALPPPGTGPEGASGTCAHEASRVCAVRPRRALQLRLRPAPSSWETPAAQQAAPSLLVGEREHRLYILKPERIDYVQAHGNYVKFHVARAEYISRDSVKRLSMALADSGFIRIERSLLINVLAICYAQRAGRGTFAFTLLSGACLRSGSSYREEILRVLPLTQMSGQSVYAAR
jgi:DNA-binding LytR/AlgR family response regulator